VFVMFVTACGSPEPRRSPDEAVLFARSGGLAGAPQRLAIAPDGKAVLAQAGSTPVEAQLTPSERDHLRSALDQAVFSAPPRLPPGRPDTFTYSVTFRGKTVEMSETTVPPGLRELLRVLVGITNRLTRKG
jgi:hypothetical protein